MFQSRPHVRNPSASGTRRLSIRLAILLIGALASRWITFGNPIVHTDEEFYLTVAHAMARNAWPYLDIWDRKPIGLFLLYLPVGALPIGAGVWAYQAMALVAVVATAAVIGALADRVGWRRGATAAGLFYIVALTLADGQGGQAPVFYNLPMALAALLAIEAKRARDGVTAMALVGVAIQIKSSVVFEGVWFGVWLMWRAYRGGAQVGRVIGYGAVLVAVALLPTVLAFGVYAMRGHADAFVYANFLSILLRRADPVAAQIDNLTAAAVILAPMIVVAAIGIVRIGGARRWFVAGWLAMAVFAFAIFGSWFNHYALPVMLPAAVGAAGVFAWRPRGRPVGPIVAGVLVATVFVAGQLVLRSERRHRGAPAEFARLVRAVGAGPGTLYVFSGSAMLYPMTGRAPLSRYVLPSHLQIRREHGAIGVDQVAEIARIFAHRPDVVVFRDPWWPEDSPAAFAALRRGLATGGYRRSAVVRVGQERAQVWRRITRRPFPRAGSSAGAAG